MKYNYPKILTKIKSADKIYYESFFPDLSYAECRGVGNTPAEALQSLKLNAEGMFMLYDKKVIAVPEPDLEITNVESVRNLLDYIYIGSDSYTSYMIH